MEFYSSCVITEHVLTRCGTALPTFAATLRETRTLNWSLHDWKMRSTQRGGVKLPVGTRVSLCIRHWPMKVSRQCPLYARLSCSTRSSFVPRGFIIRLEFAYLLTPIISLFPTYANSGTGCRFGPHASHPSIHRSPFTLLTLGSRNFAHIAIYLSYHLDRPRRWVQCA